MPASVEEQKAKCTNVIRSAAVEAAMPVDEYPRSLDDMIADICRTRDKLIPAIAAGKAPREVIRCLAMEFYYLGRWMTPDFAGFIANAPDAYALTLEQEVHAYAEPDHGDKAEALFRKVALAASVQRRCREAIRNPMLLRDARTRALNAWLA